MRLLSTALLTLLLAAPPPGSTGQYNNYFKNLMRPDTRTSCCDESDCRFTPARSTPSGWEALTQEGTWVPIPPSKILHDKKSPTGMAILCHLPTVGVLCFVLPEIMG